MKRYIQESYTNWAKISRQILKTLVATIVLLEVLLQIAAFYVWYAQQIDSTPTILCIADYDTPYPSQISKTLGKTGLKIAAEVNPGLTTNDAIKIVDSYLNKARPKIIYVTLGIDGSLESKSKITWDDSFEWKLRSRELVDALRHRNFKQLLVSQRFRTVQDPSKVDDSPSKATIGSKQVSLPATQRMASQLVTEFEKIPTIELESQSIFQNPSTFPVGIYDYHGIIFDFRSDETMNLGNFSMAWEVQGSSLTLKNKNRSLLFHWRMQEDKIILLPNQVPFTMVMTKIRSVEKASCSQKAIFSIFRTWRDLSKLEIEPVIMSNIELESIPKLCAEIPSIDALLARGYLVSGRSSEAEKVVDRLRESYKNGPSLEKAEALLFSMVQYPYEEKIGLALELLLKYPNSFGLWLTVTEYSKQAGDETLFLVAKKRALKLTPESFTETRSLVTQYASKGAYQLNSPAPSKGVNQTLLIQAMLRTNYLKKLETLSSMCSNAHVPLVFVSYPFALDSNPFLAKASSKAKARFLGAKQLAVLIPAIQRKEDSSSRGADKVRVYSTNERHELLALLVLRDIQENLNLPLQNTDIE